VLSAAAQAAAKPAGPAPTTTISNWSGRSFIGVDLHAFAANDLAGSAMGETVDGCAAFHANAHPAQRPSLLPLDGTAKAVLAGLSDCRGDDRADGDRDGAAVNADLDV
jgi:hypothetical protein